MSDYEYRVVDARGQQAHVGPFHREERARGYAQDLDIGPFAPHVVQRRTVTRGAWENIPEASGRVTTKEENYETR